MSLQKQFQLVILPSVFGRGPNQSQIREVVAKLNSDVTVVQIKMAGGPFQTSDYFRSNEFTVRQLTINPADGDLFKNIVRKLRETSNETQMFTLFWDGEDKVALEDARQLLQSKRDLVCLNSSSTFFLDEPKATTSDVSWLSDVPIVGVLMHLSNMLISDDLLDRLIRSDVSTHRTKEVPGILADLARTRIFTIVKHMHLSSANRMTSFDGLLSYFERTNPVAAQTLISYAISRPGIHEMFRNRGGEDVPAHLVEMFVALFAERLTEEDYIEASTGSCSITTNLVRAVLQGNRQWALRLIKRILNGEVNVLNPRKNDFSGHDTPLIVERLIEANDPLLHPTRFSGVLGLLRKLRSQPANTAPLLIKTTNFAGSDNAPMFDFSYSSAGGFGGHVDGWSYVVQSFLEEVGHNPHGVGFDSFIEKTYVWGLGSHIKRRDKPWFGISHRPFNIPSFYDAKSKLQFFQTAEFMLDVGSLQGVLTVASEHGRQLSELLNLKVETVLHPTNMDVATWDPACLNAANPPMLVQVGSWLRNMHSIFRLPEADVRPALLGADRETLLQTPRFLAEARAQNNGALFDDALYDRAEFLPRLDNDDYNEMLTCNIVFLDLYDATANNAVLECIARHTPVVVRKMPATKEYLGAEYPLFFDTLEQAAEKASNRALLLRAHHYLKERAQLADFTVGQFVKNVQAAFERITAS